MKKILLPTIALIALIASGVLGVLYVSKTQALNERISSLTEERDGLLTRVDELLVDEIRFPKVRIDDYSDYDIYLLPTEYMIRTRTITPSVDGVLGSIKNSALPYTDEFGDPFWFHKTSHENILGVVHQPDTLAFPEQGYIDVKEHHFVKTWDSSLDVDATVTFGFYDYALSTNLLDSEECSVLSDYDPNSSDAANLALLQQQLDDCNTNEQLFVSELLVNDEVVLSFEPEQVWRVGGAFANSIDYKYDLPETTEKPLRIAIIGVSPDLNNVYFSFLDETYSINRDGEVVEAEVPDELVKITDEPYE